MHRSEAYDLVLCAHCGAEISLGDKRSFAFGQDDALCFECSIERGGTYDEGRDDWVQAPDLRGLAELAQESR